MNPDPGWWKWPWWLGGSGGDPGQGQVSSGDYVDRHDGGLVGIGDDKWRGTYKYSREGSAGGSYVPISGYQSTRGMPAGTINAVPIIKHKPRYYNRDYNEHKKAIEIARTSNVVPWKTVGNFGNIGAHLGLAAWHLTRHTGRTMRWTPNFGGAYNSIKSGYNTMFGKEPVKTGKSGGQTMYANRSVRIERYKKKRRKRKTFYK